MKYALMALCLLVLTGCDDPMIPVKPEPFPLACPQVCFEPCDDQWPKWTPADPNSPDAWDERTEQVDIPAKAKLDRCNMVHRRACVDCLRRAEAAGAIKLQPPPPGD